MPTRTTGDTIVAGDFNLKPDVHRALDLAALGSLSPGSPLENNLSYAYVTGYGLYRYDSASSATVVSPDVIAAAPGGRWIRDATGTAGAAVKSANELITGNWSFDGKLALTLGGRYMDQAAQPARYLSNNPNRVLSPSGELGLTGWTVVTGSPSVYDEAEGGRCFYATSAFEMYTDVLVWRANKDEWVSVLPAFASEGTEVQVELLDTSRGLLATLTPWTNITAAGLTLGYANNTAWVSTIGNGYLRVRFRSIPTPLADTRFRGVSVTYGLPVIGGGYPVHLLRWLYDNRGGTGGTLDGLTDVSAPAPATGQVLKWNGTVWAPGTDDTGTGATGAYGRDLSAYGVAYNGTNESVALQSALNTLAGTTVIVSGTVLCTEITIPDDTRIIGVSPSSGFRWVANSSPGSMLKPGNRVQLINLLLDGNKVNQATAANYANAVVYINTKTGIVMRGCSLVNAKNNGVYGLKATYCHFENNHFDASEAEALFVQNSCHGNRVIGNRITNCKLDGIKLHGKDGVDTTAVSEGNLIQGNLVDYRGVTTFNGTNLLAIEIWGGAHKTRIIANHIWFDAVPPANSVFGISCDESDHVIVTSNTLEGGAGLMIENAGGEWVVISNNVCKGFRGSGLSVSRAHSRMVIANNVFSSAGTPTSRAVIFNDQQGVWVSHVITGNQFYDCGEKGIWFNGNGNGTVITGNSFTIKDQGGILRGIEALGTNDLTVRNNVFTADRAGSSAYQVEPIFISGGEHSVIEGNDMDCLVPSTDAAGGTDAIYITGSTGRYVIRNNTIRNAAGNPVDTASATGAVGNVSANLATASGTFNLRGTDVVTTANTTF